MDRIPRYRRGSVFFVQAKDEVSPESDSKDEEEKVVIVGNVPSMRS